MNGKQKMVGTVIVSADASGAYQAAQMGMIVVIVDVIDMSTTLESALEAGALAVFGAAPEGCRAPVPVNPELIGRAAGSLAATTSREVVLVVEPRVGTDEERRDKAAGVLRGLQQTTAKIAGLVPNLGAQTCRLHDFQDKIVIAVTDAGGAAYDAAYNAGAGVITGTVARTPGKRGEEPAVVAAERAISLARSLDRGIAVVAASSNAVEDLLAAQFIAQQIIARGFLRS